MGGIQWPCPSEDHPGSLVPPLIACGTTRPHRDRRRRSRSPPWVPPIDELSDEFPMRLTTGRRLDSYNTGVQSNLYSSPLRRGETLDLHPEDAANAAGRAR